VLQSVGITHGDNGFGCVSVRGFSCNFYFEIFLFVLYVADGFMKVRYVFYLLLGL
jgi:hypothetical protein